MRKGCSKISLRAAGNWNVCFFLPQTISFSKKGSAFGAEGKGGDNKASHLKVLVLPQPPEMCRVMLGLMRNSLCSIGPVLRLNDLP